MDTNHSDTNGARDTSTGTAEETARKKNGILALLDDYAAQSWPILMLALGVLALMPLLLGNLLLKLIAVIGLVWAVRELKHCQAARKAGVVYLPAKARVAYIALVVGVILMVIYFIFSALSPVAKVKEITLEACPGYTMGEIIDATMDDVDWSYDSEDSGDWVYVYGVLDDGIGAELGFKFLVEETGSYYFVIIADVWAEGYWWGDMMAYTYFMALYQSI